MRCTKTQFRHAGSTDSALYALYVDSAASTDDIGNAGIGRLGGR
jgi:hypothetical protein